MALSISAVRRKSWVGGPYWLLRSPVIRPRASVSTLPRMESPSPLSYRSRSPLSLVTNSSRPYGPPFPPVISGLPTSGPRSFAFSTSSRIGPCSTAFRAFASAIACSTLLNGVSTYRRVSHSGSVPSSSHPLIDLVPLFLDQHQVPERWPWDR